MGFFRFGWGDRISFRQNRARQGKQGKAWDSLDLVGEIESLLGNARQGKQVKAWVSLDFVGEIESLLGKAIQG
ncbi:hypothetical protein ACQP3F_31810, partial [Escherichia coli]